MKLSLIILAKNEEKNLTKILADLKFADEIIVIDNNSTDNSVPVARKSAAKVVSFKGLDFSAMRNLGRQKAVNNWLFYLDADEIISRELQAEIIKILANPEFEAYRVIRRNFYLGKKWPYEEKIIRLINKRSLVGWYGPLHESAEISAAVGQLKNPLFHYTHQNLKSMVDKTNLWSEIEADLRIKNSHPPVVWWRFIRVMITAFSNSYFKQAGFKAGTVGLIESIYQAFSIFITFAKLWEKQSKKS